MLDFDELSGGKGTGLGVTEPRKIFTTLVRHPRFKFPSDNQGEVLDKWYDKRNRTDNTIKMNTGSGKMLVGLLLLQSSLNENVGPAIYVVPDNYLLTQVLTEAKDLGIQTTTEPRDSSFLAGNSILVINIDKLVNGKSVFGVGIDGVQIPIGTLVIDDAHACLDSVSDQFRIKLKAGHPAYSKLLSLFEDGLKQQSEVGYVEVREEDPNSLLTVPFWSWLDRQPDVLQLLHAHRNDNELKFSWPLIKEIVSQCVCVFGGGALEIAPRNLPIDVIASFAKARRRVYMTATLADDGLLVSHLNADPDTVADPIKPKGAGEIGDRMIIIPNEVNPDITDDDVKVLAVQISKFHNVAVIVPSERRAAYWADVAAQTLMKANISEGISRLKSPGAKVGITVLVNRYDGVDLPEDACRLLIIDGLPETHGLIDRAESAILEDTQAQLRRQMQRLEQGMGRGVRSGEDRCAVLLLGARLTQRINQPQSRKMLTPATLAQMEMGRLVSNQIKGKPIAELLPILALCIERDTPDGVKWWQAGRARLANAPEGEPSHIDPSTVPLRKAFDSVRAGQYPVAIQYLQDAANAEPEAATKGYLKQQLAEITHRVEPVKAQEILLSAVSLNRRVTKPIAGIVYAKLSAPVSSQALTAISFMTERFLDPNQLVFFVNALASDLSWDKNRTEQFEGSIRDLGLLLGFGSQRPDKEYRSGGPDNLWALGGLSFLVIECKSGVENDGRPFTKDHSGQLSTSMHWFQASYDQSCVATPVLIHPSQKGVREASPDPRMVVLEKTNLVHLRSNLKAYAATFSAGGMLDEKKVAAQLMHFGFTGTQFVSKYTVPFKTET